MSKVIHSNPSCRRAPHRWDGYKNIKDYSKSSTVRVPKNIPQRLSCIQNLETIVIPLMSECLSEVGTNMDHSHIMPNEATRDNEGFSTHIQLSPGVGACNNSPICTNP